MSDFSPFTAFATAQIAATTASANVALTIPELPGGVVCRAVNTASTTAFVAFGDSSIAASAIGNASIPIATLESILVQLNADITHAAARTLTGSGTVYFTTGQVG